MKNNLLWLVIAFLLSGTALTTSAQTLMGNIPGRNFTSLNGSWYIIIDQFNRGISEWKPFWKDQKPTGKNDFYEYAFEGGPVLNVPGDFNSQMLELKYYEGPLWYKRTFNISKKEGKRYFLHFSAVNYFADVYLNNQVTGSHEGGFTPFQFDVTGQLKNGENSLIVRTNNQRLKESIPALDFDWYNYGGITRDISLIETPDVYIEDYFIQLKKDSPDVIEGWVKINGSSKENINIEIPEAGVSFNAETDKNGIAAVKFNAAIKPWSFESPKLYSVTISCGSDKISERIGFRNIQVKGTDILLNGKPIFLRGISIHDEIPQRKARAYSASDALQLLTWAKELGCNFVRLAHYPHNENTVRLADSMGLMVWSEIPVYWGIEFANPAVQEKMRLMLKEMVQRDKNRASIIIWSMSNETKPNPDRDAAIVMLADLCRTLDSTRLISSAIDAIKYENQDVTINDPVVNSFDVIGINEYRGWYNLWPGKPGEMTWHSDFNKPLIITEFGGEALYGNHDSLYQAGTWSEEHQEQLYRDQLKMLSGIPFLRGLSPWILVDFRTPVRLHPYYQQLWNRKGLLSDSGFRKKAWYVLNEFYRSSPVVLKYK